MSHFEGASSLQASTIRSDALILATICEQLRVELARPVYAGIDGGATLLTPTLEKLQALRETPQRADAVDLVIECLRRIIEVGTLMHGVGDDIWASRPVNSAPSLSGQGRTSGATGPLAAFLIEAKDKYEQLLKQRANATAVTARVRDAGSKQFGK